LRAPDVAPRVSGGVAHAMAVTVASGVEHRMCGGEKCRVFAASNALDRDSDLPENAVLFVLEKVARNQVTYGACVPASCPSKNGRSRALYSMSTCGCRDVTTSGVTSMPPAITMTMLHLCSAPCKALRFAPPARTRGLRALTVPARR